MNRRQYLALVALFCSSPLLGSCNLSGTSSPSPNETGTTSEAVRTDLVLFAASSLQDALSDMASSFEQEHTETQVVINFGGSSGLATQILEGGMADVFASANLRQMSRVQEAGLVAHEPLPFASNRLTVIVPADNPAAVDSLAALARPDVQLLMAIPGVPVREYTDRVLSNMAADPGYGTAYAETVYANLVSEEENVRQIVTKIALGEADAGFVYTSDLTPEVEEQVRQIEIPDTYNVVAVYPIARLAIAPNPAQAEAFVEYVLSKRGQSILRRWGLGDAPI